MNQPLQPKALHSSSGKALGLMPLLISTSAWAGRDRGGGGILMGSLGAAIAFGIRYANGEWLTPGAQTENKLAAGFFAAVFMVYVLMLIFQ